MNIAHLPSRDGSAFGAKVDVESDGALTILSNDGKGYRSAHRDHAQAHFPGHVLWCMNRLSWVNLDGVRVVMTRWHTQEYRKAPVTIFERTPA